MEHFEFFFNKKTLHYTFICVIFYDSHMANQIVSNFHFL